MNQDKIKDPIFMKAIFNMPVFSLIETWRDSGTILSIPDYAIICNSSRSKHKKTCAIPVESQYMANIH